MSSDSFVARSVTNRLLCRLRHLLSHTLTVRRLKRVEDRTCDLLCGGNVGSGRSVAVNLRSDRDAGWSMRSLITLRSMPESRDSVAYLWRKSCSRMSGPPDLPAC